MTSSVSVGVRYTDNDLIPVRPDVVDDKPDEPLLPAEPMDRNAKRIGHRGTYLGWIAIKRIRVDPVYQRGLNVRRVNDIAENFDIDVFGSILISQRVDGSMWALDGQHRVAAVQTIYGHDSDVEVPCTIVRGMTLAGEARVFYKMNRNRLTPTAFDGFKARLVFGDEVAVDVNRICQDYGVAIKYQTGILKPNEVQAIAELEKIYRRGLLSDVLGLIAQGWKDEPGAHKAVMLRGIFTFLTTFHEEFYGDDTPLKIRADRYRRLVHAMAMLPPDEVARKARFYQSNIRASAGNAIARAIHQEFNTRLHGGVRLPVWGEAEVGAAAE